MANPLKGPLAGVESAMARLQSALSGDLARLRPIHEELEAVRGSLASIADDMAAIRRLLEDERGS